MYSEGDVMDIRLWYPMDIKRVLAAIEAAFEAAHFASGEANEEYQRGVRDTLYAVARAFGIEDEGDKEQR